MIIFLSSLLVILGAIIIAASIVKLYTTLKFFRGYTQRLRGSARVISCSCMVMMVIFFSGYTLYGVFLIMTRHGDIIEFMVAVIFFLGAIFVYCMVTMQHKMSYTISQRSSETIYSLISAVEAKDLYTKGHSEHVRDIVKIFCKRLPLGYQSKINLEMLLDAAMLHDVGKIGIPDSILNKSEPLTDVEFAVIKQHPQRGYDILKQTVYNEIAKWVLYHHERVDGKGYYGVKNEALPIESKIIAIADTFSALYTDRVYRKKFSFEKSIEILRGCSSTQLDKELVEIFCTIDKSELG